MFPVLVVFVLSSIISVGTPIASTTGMSAMGTAVAMTAGVGAVVAAPVIVPIAIMGTAVVQANQ